MKYFDFITQTLILITTLLLAATYGGTGILFGQAILGGWQLLSSILSFVIKTPFRKLKNIHLAGSAVYVLLILFITSNEFFAAHSGPFIFAMVIAWALGIFYYGITWAWAVGGTKRSKFLPNISF